VGGGVSTLRNAEAEIRKFIARLREMGGEGVAEGCGGGGKSSAVAATDFTP
jgi:hypothetical protein